MNFNYDLVTWIDYFLGSFFCGLGLFLSGALISYKNIKEIKVYKYLTIVLFAIIVIFNNFIFNNAVRVFVIVFLLFGMFKILFNDKVGDLIINVIFAYIICIISEFTFSIIVTLIDTIFKVNFASIMVRMSLTNFIISLILVIYSYLFRKKIQKIIKKLKNTNITYILTVSIIVIIVVFSIMYSLYLNNFQIDYKYFLSLAIITGCLLLFFILIKQYIDNRETSNKYTLLKEYMKTSADLIEKYSSMVHKYKNNLIIIKGYIKSDIPEANNYIDSLLEKIEDKKYSWVKQINYIKIDNIRYIIYYKLSKAEEMNLKIYVNVSKDLKSLNSTLFNSYELGHILNILGEYFDNAIYASNESNEKEINFDLYILDKKLVFSIANTYKDNVNIDLITKNGFTTKGKGHGFGLYDVEKTIKNMNILNSKYEIINNYFTTKLIISLDLLNKKTNDTF